MKYGRVVFSRGIISPSICNLGDIAQMFALNMVYERMGVKPEEIIDIPVEGLGTFVNETGRVIAPINGYYRYHKKHPLFPTAKSIYPVFLAIYIRESYLKERQFWQAYGPIGCRDEATYLAMRRKGYDAYLLGCLTMLFPRRKKQPLKPKVFLVDADPSIKKYIPEKLKPYIEQICQEIPVNPDADSLNLAKECEQKARALYQRYEQEATLVVTSRLHCAAPCIAMGIPTIVVKKGFDERFGWLDRFVHLYTPDEFASIDWDPQPVDCEDFKEELMKAAISLLSLKPDRELLEKIHTGYMNRERKKLQPPFRVRANMFVSQYFPGFAEFVRLKLLYRFTINANDR